MEINSQSCVDITYTNHEIADLIARDVRDRYGVIVPKNAVTPSNKTTVKLTGEAAEAYYRHKYRPQESTEEIPPTDGWQLVVVYYNAMSLRVNPRMWVASPGGLDHFGGLHEKMLVGDSQFNAGENWMTRRQIENMIGIQVDQVFGNPIRYCMSNVFREILKENIPRLPGEQMLKKSEDYIRMCSIGLLFPVGIFFHKPVGEENR